MEVRDVGWKKPTMALLLLMPTAWLFAFDGSRELMLVNTLCDCA